MKKGRKGQRKTKESGAEEAERSHGPPARPLLAAVRAAGRRGRAAAEEKQQAARRECTARARGGARMRRLAQWAAWDAVRAVRCQLSAKRLSAQSCPQRAGGPFRKKWIGMAKTLPIG